MQRIGGVRSLSISPYAASAYCGVMNPCVIKAPDPSPSSGIRSRPILAVRYLGRIEAYALFRDGAYEFNLAPDLCAAIDEGRIQIRFQLDGGVPGSIILVSEDAASQPQNSVVFGLAR